MKEFFRKLKENLTFRDIIPMLVFVAVIALGVLGCIYLTPMLGHINWSGVYHVHG